MGVKYRILISNAETRKAFDIISILKAAFSGIGLILGDVEGTNCSSHHLKFLFCEDVERLRVSDETLFVNDLDYIAEKYKNEKIVFMPEEEETIALFYVYLRKKGERNFVFLLPEEHVFNTLRNKGELNAYCAKQGLSAPAYYDVRELSGLTADKYPILLKPCIGSGSEGQIRLYKPEHLTDDVMKVVNERPYLAQELIGYGHDVKGAFYLYDDCGMVNAYTHERIRTSPSTGGVTVFSRLTHEQDVISEGKEILDKIGWKGLIMLEFLYDEKDDKYKVIEANPRVWGSIMLSEFGGSHLLTNYVRRCIGDPLVCEFREGECYIRWFFPVDVLNYLKRLGRIRRFWEFKNTCFINWSYASKKSAIRFNLWNLFCLKNIKRFLRK